ncbi:MAG: hypothetical protein LBC69_01625 [Eubacteriaceae bacterium]|nr:hypothetical protein [Eubacteriaceae bacterium]
MLGDMATPEMLDEWKRVWREYRQRLKPNRKTGQEIIDFLKSKYSLTELHEDKYLDVVASNVLQNEPYLQKLPPSTKPLPKAFAVNNTGSAQLLFENQDSVFAGTEIFVGIDLKSGYYCVEGSSFLWDELCAYQGVDEKDLENVYCVAQYISCLKRFGLLEN